MAQARKEGSFSYIPRKRSCPRCLLTVLRPQHKRSYFVCMNCDYTAHWRQFIEGEWERKQVQKLFDKGEIKGKSFIPYKEKKRK